MRTFMSRSALTHPSRMFAVFGLPYETVMLITTIIATLWTTIAVLGIIFFAWAPYISGSWATQFGVGFGSDEDDRQATAD